MHGEWVTDNIAPHLEYKLRRMGTFTKRLQRMAMGQSPCVVSNRQYCTDLICGLCGHVRGFQLEFSSVLMLLGNVYYHNLFKTGYYSHSKLYCQAWGDQEIYAQSFVRGFMSSGHAPGMQRSHLGVWLQLLTVKQSKQLKHLQLKLTYKSNENCGMKINTNQCHAKQEISKLHPLSTL